MTDKTKGFLAKFWYILSMAIIAMIVLLKTTSAMFYEGKE